MTEATGPQLAVALDTTDVGQAGDWAAAVAAHVDVLKLGLEFFLAAGASGVAAVRDRAPDCQLFLDLKLHDIPNTVAGAARAVAALQPDYLTVHAAGGPAMIEAAAQALPDTAITAVTVLTSIGPAQAELLGLPQPSDLVTRWARLAVAAGARALVSSALEVAAVRDVVAPEVRLVTPGIRPPGAAAGDQQRVATPAAAVALGADVLVVGRPITQAPDPAAAAAAIRAELPARAV